VNLHALIGSSLKTAPAHPKSRIQASAQPQCPIICPPQQRHRWRRLPVVHTLATQPRCDGSRVYAKPRHEHCASCKSPSGPIPAPPLLDIRSRGFADDGSCRWGEASLIWRQLSHQDSASGPPRSSHFKVLGDVAIGMVIAYKLGTFWNDVRSRRKKRKKRKNKWAPLYPRT